MAIIDTLITDRTKADADRWEALRAKGYAAMTTAEKTEWAAGMKGSYNTTDLNRVGQAIAYLAGRFAGYGYSVVTAPKTDWTMPDIQTQAQMTRYLADVAELRGAITARGTTPLTPASMEALTWVQANAIEQILFDTDHLITNMTAAFRHSGAATSGMGGLIR